MVLQQDNVDNLVYFEEVENELAARKREKQIKGWLREKKIKLIDEMNPEWDDLAAPFLDDILGKSELNKNIFLPQNKLGDSSPRQVGTQNLK